MNIDHSRATNVDNLQTSTFDLAPTLASVDIPTPYSVNDTSRPAPLVDETTTLIWLVICFNNTAFTNISERTVAFHSLSVHKLNVKW